MTGNLMTLLLSGTLLRLLPTAILTWIFGTIIYRLCFHPLAKVPGPKLAGITWLYQTYYSFVGGSRFYLQVERLHHQYGK